MCLVIGEGRAFDGKSDFKHGNAYLIENPSVKDLEVKADLEMKYNQYLQVKLKTAEAKREAARKKNAEFKNLEKPVVGDLLDYSGDLVLYLGICSVEEEGVVKEGHTYLKIPRFTFNAYYSQKERKVVSERFIERITKDSNIDFKTVMNYCLDRYDRDKYLKSGVDIYMYNSSDIMVSKNYSRKFTSILYHVNLTDWDLGCQKSIVTKFFETKYRSRDIVVTLTNKNKN